MAGKVLDMTTLPEEPASTDTFAFMALPPEIRDAVYKILLVRDEPVIIASPRKRSFRDLISSSGTSSILYTNRLVHNEAIKIFYMLNTFVVGNGQHLSTKEANAHAFRLFVTYVPKDLLESITRVNILIGLHLIEQFRGPRTVPNPDESTILGLGTASNASDVRQICRSLVKHLTGLRSVRIDWTYCPLGKSSIIYQLDRSATVSGLSNCMHRLMTMPGVRQLRLSNHPLAGIQDIAVKVTAEELADGRRVQMRVFPDKIALNGFDKLAPNRSNHGEIEISWLMP